MLNSHEPLERGDSIEAGELGCGAPRWPESDWLSFLDDSQTGGQATEVQSCAAALFIWCFALMVFEIYPCMLRTHLYWQVLHQAP